jgi:hypothetical protein
MGARLGSGHLLFGTLPAVETDMKKAAGYRPAAFF